MSENSNVGVALVWPWLLSIVGSICGTVITLLLASSPTLNMVGATVGATVPQLMGAAGSLWHLRVSIGIGITVAAIGFTSLGFTAGDAIEGVPGCPLTRKLARRVAVDLRGPSWMTKVRPPAVVGISP
ncbi:MAG TPA: hypothetical protein VIU11_24300 [Nakamurella sp.]